MLDEGKNKGLVGRHILTLSPAGLTDTSDTGETTTNWASVEKIVRTDQRILIYNSAIGAFVIPVRAFENKEQIEEFIQNVENYREEK